MTDAIKDADKQHWVYYAPKSWRPFLQLARYDRPIGYWLLALPCWMGLALAGITLGLEWTDLKWAALLFIGALAMRGAGCTYNDIVDRDLDAKVDRTALRPLPAGTVSVTQAWLWLCVQCGVGLLVLLTLPRTAQIIALCSIPLVAAYPFMKRITWWPQVWLGMTFNWGVLVAFAIKTGTLNPGVIVYYIGLIFWTIGYDTIYACQDIEDDALIGVKSTARLFGDKIKGAVSLCYAISIVIIIQSMAYPISQKSFISLFYIIIAFAPTWVILGYILEAFKPSDGKSALALFKLNRLVGFGFVYALIVLGLIITPS